MTVLGDKFECEEVFIPELIMGGEIMKGIAGELKPRIKGEAAAGGRGTIVLGTVAGDIHDIGKDVVVLMLDVNGYDVHDLGIDVPVEEFVAAVRELKPQVVGLSGLLTLAFDAMKATVAGIADAGLRDEVRIMIGGSPVDEQICAYTGADGWGRDAAAALRMAAEWTGGAA
jgi:5-methyltetrahydrofolate--homocysteine methyltransferase